MLERKKEWRDGENLEGLESFAKELRLDHISSGKH